MAWRGKAKSGRRSCGKVGTVKTAPDFTHNHSGRSAKRKDTLRDQQDFFYGEKTRASQREGKEDEKNGMAGAFFSIGFALLTSFTENRRFPVLKSRVAKPESDLKIPPISGGSLPRALSDFTPCIPRYTVTDSLTLLPVELAGLSHRLPVYPYPV